MHSWPVHAAPKDVLATQTPLVQIASGVHSLVLAVHGAPIGLAVEQMPCMQLLFFVRSRRRTTAM
jgi:hypothetical protein